MHLRKICLFDIRGNTCRNYPSSRHSRAFVSHAHMCSFEQCCWSVMWTSSWFGFAFLWFHDKVQFLPETAAGKTFFFLSIITCKDKLLATSRYFYNNIPCYICGINLSYFDAIYVFIMLNAKILTLKFVHFNANV